MRFQLLFPNTRIFWAKNLPVETPAPQRTMIFFALPSSITLASFSISSIFVLVSFLFPSDLKLKRIVFETLSNSKSRIDDFSSDGWIWWSLRDNSNRVAGIGTMEWGDVSTGIVLIDRDTWWFACDRTHPSWLRLSLTTYQVQTVVRFWAYDVCARRGIGVALPVWNLFAAAFLWTGIIRQQGDRQPTPPSLLSSSF